MQNTNISRTRRGIQLNQIAFKRAIEKAEKLQPRVLHIGAHYAVLQSDQRSWAEVVFRIYEGRLFASCTCKAHCDSAYPLACYHIAAAAMSRQAAARVAAPAPAPAPASAGAAGWARHDHCCPECRSLYSCRCSSGETDDLICDDCGSRQLDWAASYDNVDKAAWV